VWSGPEEPLERSSCAGAERAVGLKERWTALYGSAGRLRAARQAEIGEEIPEDTFLVVEHGSELRAGFHAGEQRLIRSGQLPPALELKSMLLWLSPQVALRELPVLPQTHAGREDALTLVRYDQDAQLRWVLRFWDVDARLGEGERPIWVGSLIRQKLEPRMHLFTFAIDDPLSRAPADLLAPAWQGLQTRVVQSETPGGPRITLIVE